MPIALLAGRRVRYELGGTPSGPSLMFANSLGTDLSLWDPQMPALEGRYRVLRFDARGHGQSELGDGPCTIEVLGRDALSLLDALGLGRVHFCGLSIGGQMGQWLGAHAPERLDRLVISNTAAHIGTAETWNARIAAVREHGTGVLMPGLLERWFTAAFRERAPAAVARAEAMVRATTAAGYTALCEAVRDSDATPYLGRITAPTLVIAGAADPVTTPADGRALAAAIAGARYVELPAAHLANVEAADAFTAALLAFLDGEGA